MLCATGGGCRPAGSDDCGNGKHCRMGSKCASGGCIPRDAVDCGNGRHCRAGYLCVPGGGCMTQQQIDQRNADQQRAREAEIERQRAEAERRRIEAERRRIEAERRAAEAREMEERAARARRERQLEEQRLEAVRRFTRDTDLCRQYFVERCDAALAAANVSAGDRVQLAAWRETALQYARDFSACRDGTVSACTSALASPAAKESDRATLQQWRAQASPIYRALDFAQQLSSSALASTQSLATSIRELPTSTHIAGGIAAGLALALIGLVAVRRRAPSAPDAGEQRRSPPRAAGFVPDDTIAAGPHMGSAPDPAPTDPPAGPPEAEAPADAEPHQPLSHDLAELAPDSPPPQIAAPPPSAPALLAAGAAATAGADGASFPVSRILGNAPTFVILYLLIMLPTYFLPYLGSNSTVLNTAGAAAGAGLNPLFWLHLLCLAALVAIGLSRGIVIERAWVVIFPILALVFDLTPGLSFIPLVPTVMHLLMIILGLALGPKLTIPAGVR
jgi:hypothetical protein